MAPSRDTLRMGIIGSGLMGQTYAEVTARHNRRARLVAVAGGRRAPGLAAAYAVDCAPSVEALLARQDIDAVILAATEAVRPTHTCLAAAAGKHVLAEKPMANSVAECEAMIAACQAADVTLMVVQSQRFRGVHARAYRLLREGVIGRVRQIRMWSMFPASWAQSVVAERPWYADSEAGFYLGHCVHCFDLMRWMAGTEARGVYAHLTSYGDHGIPDLSCVASVEFADNVTGDLWVSLEMPPGSYPHQQFRSQVIGEAGVLDFDGYTHLDLIRDGATRRIWEQPAFNLLDPLDPVRLESFTTLTQAFIDSVLNGEAAPVTGADGRAAVELCQAARQSSRLRQPVDLLRH